jgi:hypothetical protein
MPPVTEPIVCVTPLNTLEIPLATSCTPLLASQRMATKLRHAADEERYQQSQAAPDCGADAERAGIGVTGIRRRDADSEPERSQKEERAEHGEYASPYSSPRDPQTVEGSVDALVNDRGHVFVLVVLLSCMCMHVYACADSNEPSAEEFQMFGSGDRDRRALSEFDGERCRMMLVLVHPGCDLHDGRHAACPGKKGTLRGELAYSNDRTR